MITFTADRIKVTGPKIDGSYSVTFETGEYEVEKVSEIMKLKPMVIVTVEESK